MFACAGSLNPKPFGPPVVPPLGSQELTGLFDAKNKWVVTKDPTEHARRSVYLLERRTFTYPLFAAFDPPEVMTSCPQRARTIVPTQALTLLNSPLAREQSLVFARRLRTQCGDKPENVVRRAWQLAFGRAVSSVESERAVAFLHRRAEGIGRAGGVSPRSEAPADGPLSSGAQAPGSSSENALADLCLALFNANEFIYVD
jgi:hypothetical protein